MTANPKHAALPDGYTLRPFQASDVPSLLRVEDRATELLAEHGFPSLLDEESETEAAFRAKLEGKSCWVISISESDKPVGYAVAGDLDGLFWLYQMSVDPAHGQRGLGKALLSTVIDHANWAYYNAIGLSTFREVPFNQAFYSRFGFMVSKLNAAPESVQNRFKAEVPPNIHPGSRVLMIKKL